MLLPLAAALAHYLENLSQYLILRRYQAQHARAGALVVFSAIMTVVKILLFFASLLLIIAGMLKLLFE